jgi:hypothetical protein
MNARLITPALGLLLVACADTPAPKPRPTLTREELMDPETCKGCHPTHYQEWKASMHAYASEDPVFVAMNELGQQETDGGMGDFCVQCHAPMALREGETSDGRNLDELPDHLKGVTCYFCHNIESVEGDHNAQLTLANDTTMRGGLEDPVRPSAHRVAFSRFLDRKSPDSSRMCGACHDIVNDSDVHLERTFEEYEASIFGAYDKPSFASCIGCHMDSRTDVAAVDAESDVGLRTVHSHLFAGVDVALTSWPDREIYKKAVECELEDSAFFVDDEPPMFDGANTITLMIDTNAGHNMPSGSSQDRRLWVELTGFDANGAELCTTGAVPDDVAVVGFRDPIDCNPLSPGVGAFRDRIFDADGAETHMFWRAAPSAEHPDGFSNSTLMPQQQDMSPHTREIDFVVSTFDGVLPHRLRFRLMIRAMDHDVLEELIEHDLLDPAVAAEIPTFAIIGGEREMQLDESGFYEWLPPPPRDRDCRIETICNFAPDAVECSE